jgi:holo-[acyl-carrier protein] synthase
LGIGIDIIDLGRIERLHRRHGAAFVRRFCRDDEWERRQGAALYEHLGGLWAAKEAMLKALGTGWAQGLAFRQVEVVRLASGAPTVRLHAAAAERAELLGVSQIHVSISHERSHAVAMALLEGGPIR